MSHLGGFQIQKAIIVIFPIPFWQNYTSATGRLVHSRQLPSRIYQGKKTSVGYQKDDQESQTTRFRILLPPIQQRQENSCMRIFKQGHDSPTISNNINAKKKTNHELAFGKMSHLGGFQIQKAIILIFPIPFWQNYTSAFGRLVHTKTTSVQNLPGKENVSGILER